MAKEVIHLMVLVSEFNNEYYDQVAQYSTGLMIDKLYQFQSLNPRFIQEVTSVFAQINPNDLFYFRQVIPFVKTRN